MSEVRVRFAPSPTGFLHIGGARTALFNWLFARQQGGKLILRVEDTDAERSTEEATRTIVEGLEWMGLDWDVGPYLQSGFLDQHRELAQKLVDQGKAYLCFCDKEELDRRRGLARERGLAFLPDERCRGQDPTTARQRASAGEPCVVRLVVPTGESGDDISAFDDLVFGHIEVKLQDIEDFVIVRSNGLPLYNFANVVDDHRDGITHVIRGADGLTNTPKQVLIYKALGWPVPLFAHLPLMLDPAKAKISKRKHGEMVTVEFYKQHGFLPWGFCNYLALMGWGSGDDREIYLEPEELIQAFSLERVSRTNSVFDYRKADPKFITDPKAIAVNSEHIRKLDVEYLFEPLKGWLSPRGLWDAAFESEKREWFLSTVDMLRVRCRTLEDFTDRCIAYFSDDFPMEPKAEKNLMKDPSLGLGYERLAEAYMTLDPFDLAGTEQVLRNLAEELGMAPGLLINGTRAAVTGQSVGPGLFDVLTALGKNRVVQRLDEAARKIKSKQ